MKVQPQHPAACLILLSTDNDSAILRQIAAVQNIDDRIKLSLKNASLTFIFNVKMIAEGFTFE